MVSIRKRTRFFVAAEGESEQSFIKWVQELADTEGLAIHLECKVLGGGGYKGMLETAIVYQKRGLTKAPYKASFMFIDRDRTETGDWSLEELQQNVATAGMHLCSQKPRIEGLFFRMHAGRENEVVSSASVDRQLESVWPTYSKPEDARSLCRKFSLADLRRVASLDAELSDFLNTIGLL